MVAQLVAEPMYRIPAYRIQLIRDSGPEVVRDQVTRPENAAGIIRGYLGDPDREHLVALLLDMKNRPVGIHTVSIGQLDSAMVRVADVFKAAILANAAVIILGHNHPSGDPAPSRDDIRISQDIAQAGNLLGIALLDHVILGEAGRHVSMKEQGHV